MTKATLKTRQESECKSDIESILSMHEEFRAKYAPEDKIERDKFEAYLSILLHTVAKDAVRPFVNAAVNMLSMQQPIPPRLDKLEDLKTHE